jgi:hypothetical protein
MKTSIYYYFDVNAVPRHSFQDLGFAALDVKAEIIHFGLADGQQDGIQWETLQNNQILLFEIIR